jgi:hypothetical protein
MNDCCSEKNLTNEDVSINDLEGLICYCFKKSKKELYQSVVNKTEDELLADIKRKMKDPGCFCERSNPKGSCCLSDIQLFIKTVKTTL